MLVADILTLCGGVHNFDFVPDGIRIYNCADMVVNPQFRISSNTELKDSIKYIGNVEHKTSIEDRKTSVKVISDTDVLTTLKDENSIAQFGFCKKLSKSVKMKTQRKWQKQVVGAEQYKRNIFR